LNVKNYLRQARRLNDIINAKFEQIEKLREMATNITSQISAEPGGSNVPDKLAEVVAKIADMEDGLLSDIDRLLELKREIADTINNLEDGDYKLLLTLRYLNFKSWEEIAVEMNFSYKWIHIIHNRALFTLGKRIHEST